MPMGIVDDTYVGVDGEVTVDNEVTGSTSPQKCKPESLPLCADDDSIPPEKCKPVSLPPSADDGDTIEEETEAVLLSVNVDGDSCPGPGQLVDSDDEEEVATSSMVERPTERL